MNKNSLGNFVKSSDKLAVICCLENGFVLESRVCILLDSIRTNYILLLCCCWNLGLACLLDPNLFYQPAVMSILCFYCETIVSQCDLLICDMT